MSNDYGDGGKLNLSGEVIKSKEPFTIGGDKECKSDIMQFHKDGEVAGTLDFSSEPITFTGNADVSAQILFETFIQLVAGEVGRLRDERDDACELLNTIGDMCPVYTADKVPEYIDGLKNIIKNLKTYTKHEDTCASIKYDGKYMGGNPGNCDCGLTYVLGFTHVQ
jgi:hypothetical protein